MSNAPNQVRKRFVLIFPKDLIEKPIIYDLTRKFQVRFNILNASITPEREGRMVIELAGTAQYLNDASLYLENIGIKVDSLNHEVRHNENQCIHCGTCEGFCPTEALYVDRTDMTVKYDDNKCILCERCLTACPTHAMEFQFR